LDRTRKEGLVGALENLVFDDKMKTYWLNKVGCVHSTVEPLFNIEVQFRHAASSNFVKSCVAANGHDGDNDLAEGGREKK
jgi:hypothetical protein